MVSLREDQAFCSCILAGDISCPRFTEPKPTAGRLGTRAHDVVDSPTEATGTKHPQKPITCSLCKGKGHTKRTCTLKKWHNTHFSSFHLHNT